MNYSVLLLSVVAFSISLCIYVLDASAELTPSDKQEIKQILADSIKHEFEDVLFKESNHMTSETGRSFYDPPNDFLFLNKTQIPMGITKFVAPDILGIEYSVDNNFLNAEMFVTNFLPPLYANRSGIYITYEMTISTVSDISNTHIQYVVSMSWNTTAQSWQQEITKETSVSTQIISSKKISSDHFPFPSGYNGLNGIIPFNVDLNDLNLPNEYSIFFDTVTTGLNPISLKVDWKIDDATAGTIVPYPEFTISSADSVDLRPGEAKDIRLDIKSPTHLKSYVTFTSNNNNGINSTFTPSKVLVPPLGSAQFLLHLESHRDSSTISSILPLTALISFQRPQGFISYHNVTQNSSLIVNTLPIEPLNLAIPQEALAGIYGLVISAIIGWSIPNIASWINETKRRRHFLHFITTIDSTYDKLGKDENQFRRYLDTVKREMEYALGGGKISESQYDLLKNKIADYYSEK